MLRPSRELHNAGTLKYRDLSIAHFAGRFSKTSLMLIRNRPFPHQKPCAPSLPSTDSAAAFGPALFVRFFGTMESSDSLGTCMSVVRQKAFSDRPAPCDAGVSRVSRFPCREFPRMRRVLDSAASMFDLRLSPLMMLPSPCQNKVGTPKK